MSVELGAGLGLDLQDLSLRSRVAWPKWEAAASSSPILKMALTVPLDLMRRIGRSAHWELVATSC